MAQTSINIRIDEDIKKDAETLFSNLGMNISTAVNIFVRQALNERGIPFQIKEATDDFYNETNMRHLRESIRQSEEGKVIVKTMQELEELANE